MKDGGKYQIRIRRTNHGKEILGSFEKYFVREG